MDGKTIIEAINRGIDSMEATQWPTVAGGILDRSKYVTASEIGQCARKVKFDKQALVESGYVPEAGTKYSSKDDWGFFARGHNVEAWVVDMLHAGWDGGKTTKDYKVLFTGADQVSFTDEFQSGTPDGVLVGEKDLYILEFKSFDPRSNVSRFPKLEHRDQVMQNLDLVSDYFNLSPAGGVLLYINASDYKRRLPFMIEPDYAHMERLQVRAKWIMETAVEDLEPEGMFKSKGCTYCAHTAVCSALIAKSRNGETDNAYHETGRKLFG